LRAQKYSLAAGQPRLMSSEYCHIISLRKTKKTEEVLTKWSISPAAMMNDVDAFCR
jgi:hypothetical protein